MPGHEVLLIGLLVASEATVGVIWSAWYTSTSPVRKLSGSMPRPPVCDLRVLAAEVTRGVVPGDVLSPLVVGPFAQLVMGDDARDVSALDAMIRLSRSAPIRTSSEVGKVATQAPASRGKGRPGSPLPIDSVIARASATLDRVTGEDLPSHCQASQSAMSCGA